MTLRAYLTALTLVSASFAPALGHEFWIEPNTYRISPADKIEARTINGEFFKGVELSYSSSAFEQSGVIAGDARTTIPGKTGDRPAISVSPAGPGLNVLYHASSISVLTYEEMAKFEKFLKGKKLDWGIQAHRDRGLPETKIREAYFRMVKALVAVGDGAGADKLVGMPLELVALTNPYTSSSDITVRLYQRGKPLPNYPIYVFRKQGSDVEKLDLKTDGSGNVVVPRAGGGEFMVNAVELSETSERIKDVSNADWQTIWAALNYEIK